MIRDMREEDIEWLTELDNEEFSADYEMSLSFYMDIKDDKDYHCKIIEE